MPTVARIFVHVYQKYPTMRAYHRIWYVSCESVDTDWMFPTLSPKIASVMALMTRPMMNSTMKSMMYAMERLGTSP